MGPEVCVHVFVVYLSVCCVRVCVCERERERDRERERQREREREKGRVKGKGIGDLISFNSFLDEMSTVTTKLGSVVKLLARVLSLSVVSLKNNGKQRKGMFQDLHGTMCVYVCIFVLSVWGIHMYTAEIICGIKWRI